MEDKKATYPDLFSSIQAGIMLKTPHGYLADISWLPLWYRKISRVMTFYCQRNGFTRARSSHCCLVLCFEYLFVFLIAAKCLKLLSVFNVPFSSGLMTPYFTVGIKGQNEWYFSISQGKSLYICFILYHIQFHWWFRQNFQK